MFSLKIISRSIGAYLLIGYYLSHVYLGYTFDFKGLALASSSKLGVYSPNDAIF